MMIPIHRSAIQMGAIRMISFRTILLSGLLGLAGLLGATPLQADALPGDSVYHLDVPLVDQDGRGLRFADARGKPRLVSMFYTSCKYVCPLIIDSLLKTEHALPAAERGKLDMLLVSLDPERDTPQALKRIADQRKLAAPHWRLARTDEAHVRRLAAVLGIQYKQLEDGEFSHSSALILLDGEGRILARTERLGETDPQFVAAVGRAIAP